jgi:hypothetical protein
LKKKLLVGLAAWAGLLVLGGICAGMGGWQLRVAANTVRQDNFEESDVASVVNRVEWANVMLLSARYNPAVLSLRLVPGLTWISPAVSAGSNVVSHVHGVLENGGELLMATVISGELTPRTGEIDVQKAEFVARTVAGIDGRIAGLRTAVAQFDDISIPFVDDEKRIDTVAKADEYLDLAESGIAALKQLPQLIGVNEPARFFVGVTNSAELRAVQGIIGEYAIVNVDGGKISVESSGSNTDLENPQRLPAELIGEYSQIYGERNTEWQNMNLSPFFDHAAVQVTHAWKMQTGQSLNGVVLLDTVALAKWAIPKVGVVETAQGRRLETWEALADYLSNGIYFDFPTDQFARKGFQSAIASELITAITGTAVDPQQVVKSLAQPMIDGRVVVWLNGEMGNEFNKTLLAHSMTWSQDDVVVGFNNWTGNKMDFYLKAGVGWSACGTFVLTLSSTADSEVAYPDYLARRLDFDVESEAEIGSLLDVNIALPKGVSVLSVLADGEMAAIDTYPIDGNRTVVRSTIEISTGLSSEIVFTLNSSFQCQTHTIRVAPLRHDVVVR